MASLLRFPEMIFRAATMILTFDGRYCAVSIHQYLRMDPLSFCDRLVTSCSMARSERKPGMYGGVLPFKVFVADEPSRKEGWTLYQRNFYPIET
jgi:hypothetical protein